MNHFSLKREVDEAIAMIRDRIGAGEKGWLSISPDNSDTGNLSLSEEQDSEE